MGKQILNLSNVKRTIRYLQKNGAKHAYYAVKERIEEEKSTKYCYEAPSREVLAEQRKKAEEFPYLLSIVVPAYETRELFLRELLDSVLEQSYENWELIIADASSTDKVKQVVEEYKSTKHKKYCNQIQYLHLEENKGISENTNAGIAAAKGDYIGLLDHDDFLTPDALYETAKAVQEQKKTGNKPVLCYSDEDKYDNNTCNFIQPNRKENFNLDLILSNNYICHLMFVQAEVMKELKLRKAYDGAQDYDLVLRTVGKLWQDTKATALCSQIIHIPKVLYHWRCHEASTAGNTASKTYAYEAGKAALEAFCQERGWQVTVSHARHLGFYEIAYCPDIFVQRSEAGVVGGRILSKNNKITSGIYNEEGQRLYTGLHKEYSGGSTHLAVLQQDCLAVDIRCMRVRKELQPVFEQVCGISYVEKGEQHLADVSAISCDEEGYRKLSLAFGKAVREKGYLSIWNPRLSIKTRN